MIRKVYVRNGVSSNRYLAVGLVAHVVERLQLDLVRRVEVLALDSEMGESDFIFFSRTASVDLKIYIHTLTSKVDKF
jgi:hypothetical protein